MITEDLIAYIQAQTRKNTPEGVIRSRLIGAGWHVSDVDEAFIKLAPPVAPVKKIEPPILVVQPTPSTPSFTPTVSLDVSQKEPKADPYHESISGGEPEAMNKVWTPIKLVPKEKVLSPLPEKKVVEQIPVSQAPIARAVFSTSFSEANPKPVFTPRVAPVTPTPQVQPAVPLAPTPTRAVEVRSEELLPTLMPKVARPVFTPAPVVAPVQAPVMPVTPPAPIEIPVTPVVNGPVPNPAFAPAQAQAPTPVATPVQPITPKETTIPSSFAGLKITTSMPLSDTPEVSLIPNGALLHSYKRALMSRTRIEHHSSGTGKKILKVFLIVFIFSLLAGVAFAFIGKYIPIPTFSFIKKDPKTLLLTSPITLNELKSYKIETTAVISLPPLGNITTGLISGQSVMTTDKDTFSLSALGIVNHEDESMPVFDYKAIFKSPLFNNPLNINLKYNNIVSLITTPDLTELLGKNSPETATVLVAKGQFDAFIALLPDSIQSKAEKINIDKLFSVGVPSYINDETSGVFKHFVDSATVVEKEPENVHGMLSYHYELSADQPSTKKFILEFVTVFTEGLSPEDKELLTERLGAVTIDSFEVWVGKEDSKIHQYKIILKSPLSRLIGLDDSGIAGNVVTLDWKTTYYDFNVHNDIEIPTNVVLVSEFMKKVSDMKITDKISSFGLLAQNLRTAIGNYGTRSNQTGSCTNPNPSSLFSPVGHAKGGSIAVGNIASAMNDILSTTGGALACYSSSTAWALAAPLPSSPTTSFCTDSTGVLEILSSPITGPVCK